MVKQKIELKSDSDVLRKKVFIDANRRRKSFSPRQQLAKRFQQNVANLYNCAIDCFQRYQANCMWLGSLYPFRQKPESVEFW